MKSQIKIIIWALYLLVLIIIPLALYPFRSKIDLKNVTRAIPNKFIEVVHGMSESELEIIADKDLLTKKGKYAVVVKNLKTGEFYSLNPDKKFKSASLFKLWVMGATFEKIASGQIKQSETVTSQIEPEASTTISQNPSEIIDTAPTPTPTPFLLSDDVSSAIEKMITVSDNNAAMLLINRIGRGNIQDFLEKYELNGSTFNGGLTYTTATDIAHFYEDLYLGKIINQEYSKQMMEVLKRQKLNDRIPKYLPSQVTIAHKTGELDEVKHDAGIVFSSSGDYIIVVLSQGDNPGYSAERIANFSKDVYEYFKNK